MGNQQVTGSSSPSTTSDRPILFCQTAGQGCALVVCGAVGASADEENENVSAQLRKQSSEDSATEKTTASNDGEDDLPKQANHQTKRNKAANRTIQNDGAQQLADTTNRLDAILNGDDNNSQEEEEDDREPNTTAATPSPSASLEVLRSMSGSINREARFDLVTSRCSTDGRESCSEMNDDGTQSSLIVLQDNSSESIGPLM